MTLDDFRWAKADQRREPRTIVSKRVWVYVPEEVPQSGHLVDCSPHGVGIVLQRPLREGERFGLKLRLDRLRLVTYSVRYCRGEGNRYRVGALLCGVDGRDGSDEVESVFRSLLEAAAPRQ